MKTELAVRFPWLFGVVWAFIAFSCGGRGVSSSGGTDGNTHWLGYCTSDSDCESGLSCLCQTCTKACDETAACSDLDAQAACLDVAASCGTNAPERTCSASCDTAEDCPGSGLDCQDERCVAVGLPNNVSCDAMDAREAPMIPCTSVAAYVWDGEGCVAILACACMGDDCDSTFDDRESCYDAHSTCSVRCPKLADECPEGCGSVRGIRYFPDRECGEGGAVVLGCDGSGRSLTGDANCLQSPDGVIVHAVSGTHVQQLMDYGGYTMCTGAMIDTARAAHECGDCNPMDARTTGNECGGIAGYTWDGEGCVAIQCSCMGDDCGAIFEDRESCLEAFSSCSVECPKIADECPAGCTEVRGALYHPELGCRIYANVLGCAITSEEGGGELTDSNCLQAPDGTLVGVSGTWVPQLLDYGGYQYCNDDGQSTLFDASACISNCPVVAGGCPQGCSLLTATTYSVERECRGDVLLGCFAFETDGAGETGALNCLLAPDGTPIGVNGAWIQYLVDDVGYTRCGEPEETALLGAAVVCMPGDPSLEGRKFSISSTEGVPPEVAAAEIGVQFRGGLFTFSTDCNGGTSGYSLCDGNLCVNGFSSTTEGCDATVDDWLTAFFTARPAVTLDGENLTFTNDTEALGFVEVVEN